MGEGATLWREGVPALPHVRRVQSGTNTSAVLISMKSRGDEPPLRASSFPKRRKDVASWRCRKKLRTGLGNMYSLANMAITADVCMCTREVRSAA